MSKTNATEEGGSSGGLAATPTQAGARVSSLPPQGASGAPSGGVIDRRRLQELVKEVDPLEQMDEDVEEVKTCFLLVTIFLNLLFFFFKICGYCNSVFQFRFFPVE
jgi:hypothetical protein